MMKLQPVFLAARGASGMVVLQAARSSRSRATCAPSAAAWTSRRTRRVVWSKAEVQLQRPSVAAMWGSTERALTAGAHGCGQSSGPAADGDDEQTGSHVCTNSSGVKLANKVKEAIAGKFDKRGADGTAAAEVAVVNLERADTAALRLGRHAVLGRGSRTTSSSRLGAAAGTGTLRVTRLSLSLAPASERCMN